MILHIGMRQYPVASLAEASVRYQLARGTRPSSRMPTGVVMDEAGRAVARVSYNGRVWSPGEPRELLCEAAQEMSRDAR